MNRHPVFLRDLINSDRSRNASLEEKKYESILKTRKIEKKGENDISVQNIKYTNESQGGNCENTQLNEKNEAESHKIEKLIEDYLKSNTNNFTTEKNEIIKLVNNIAEELKETTNSIKNTTRDLSDRFNNEFYKVNSSLADIQQMNRMKSIINAQNTSFPLAPALNVEYQDVQSQPKVKVEKEKRTINKNINCFKRLDDQQKEGLLIELGIGSLVGKEIFVKENKYYVGIGKKKITIDEFKKLII